MTPSHASLPGAMSKEWLTPKEICALLQIPEQTFYQWCVKHTGPQAHRISRQLRISRQEFEAWLSSNREH
jgi:excisionase family DNA binding protein